MFPLYRIGFTTFKKLSNIIKTVFGNALKLQYKNVICVHINKKARNKLSTTLDLTIYLQTVQFILIKIMIFDFNIFYYYTQAARITLLYVRAQ